MINIKLNAVQVRVLKEIEKNPPCLVMLKGPTRRWLFCDPVAQEMLRMVREEERRDKSP